jgi:hypothetical protein
MDGGVHSAGSIRWTHELTIEAFSIKTLDRVTTAPLPARGEVSAFGTMTAQGSDGTEKRLFPLALIDRACHGQPWTLSARPARP